MRKSRLRYPPVSRPLELKDLANWLWAAALLAVTALWRLVHSNRKDSQAELAVANALVARTREEMARREDLVALTKLLAETRETRMSREELAQLFSGMKKDLDDKLDRLTTINVDENARAGKARHQIEQNVAHLNVQFAVLAAKQGVTLPPAPGPAG